MLKRDKMNAITVIVSGRVQGVGFRDFTRRTAQSLGVTGWVRNRGDDTVEVRVEGEEGQLDQLLDALGDGPVERARRGGGGGGSRADWGI